MHRLVASGTIVGFALAGGGTGWNLAQNLVAAAAQAGVYGTNSMCIYRSFRQYINLQAVR
jgi:hypothetical protein